jgi:hypothetical protein
MKQAGNIRRPYFAQAVAVISLCRFLARHYENLTKEERTAINVEPLEEYVVNSFKVPRFRARLTVRPELAGKASLHYRLQRPLSRH